MFNRHSIIRNPFVHEEEKSEPQADAQQAAEPRLAINAWAEEDRPREKLMAHGAESLSEAELLAILIGSGTPKESAVDLMSRILRDHCDSLGAVGRMSLQELMSYKGIGEAKAITILAACELGKRRMKEHVGEKLSFENSEDLYAYIHPRMMDLTVEQCHLLLLDIKHHPIGYKVVSTGGISGSAVDVRVVLQHAILGGAVSVVFCHNHPSGSASPSREDDAITRRLKTAFDAVGIKLIDHIVVGQGTYYSYYDNEKL